MPPAEREPPQSYPVLDAEGRPIGRVPLPDGRPAVGPGARTVLLIRERNRSTRPAA